MCILARSASLTQDRCRYSKLTLPLPGSPAQLCEKVRLQILKNRIDVGKQKEEYDKTRNKTTHLQYSERVCILKMRDGLKCVVSLLFC